MKRYITILIIFCIAIFLLVSNKKESITINSFTDLPSELNGGSCVFALNDKELEDKKFVFVNDYANFGYGVLNNKEERFVLEKYDLENDIFVYSNERYKLELHILNSKTFSPESSNVEATIYVTNKKELYLTKNVFGQCGA